jgi:hypothetical protein
MAFLIFSLSAILWFAIGFLFKYYLDRQQIQIFNALKKIDNSSDDDDPEIGQELLTIMQDIVNSCADLLENVESLEQNGDIYNYKISSKYITKLDELYANLDMLAEEN